jgi:uncharacterized protein YaaQ
VKLIVCVVHLRDRHRVSDELIRGGYKFTALESTGGFLRESNATLLIGCDEDHVEAVLSVIESNCPSREQVVTYMPMEASPAGAILTSPVKVPIGGAVAFVLNVEQFTRI